MHASGRYILSRRRRHRSGCLVSVVHHVPSHSARSSNSCVSTPSLPQSCTHVLLQSPSRLSSLFLLPSHLHSPSSSRFATPVGERLFISLRRRSSATISWPYPNSSLSFCSLSSARHGVFSFLSSLTPKAKRASGLGSGEGEGPGILALPGVHTPEELVRLGQRAVADCEALLATGATPTSAEAEATTEQNSASSLESASLSVSKEAPPSDSADGALAGSWEDARRAVQALDAVSNTLCKVADGAELLRQVHPDAKWKQAGAQVVGDVQEFMSRVNVNNKVYERLQRLAEELGPDLAQPAASEARPQAGGEGAMPSTAACAVETVAGARLTQEEAVVFRSMREAMEQQGVFLERDAKDRYLSLMAEEAALAAEIAQHQEEPQHREGLWLPVRALLASGLRAELLEHSQHSERDRDSLFSPFRQRGGFRRGGRDGELHVTVVAESELAHAVLRESRDPALRRDVYTLQKKRNRNDQMIEAHLFRLLGLRQELAKLRGYESWAAYAQRDGILRTPKNVDAFLSRLLHALQPGVETELRTLSSFGAATGLLQHTPASGNRAGLEAWDIPFLMHAYNAQATDRSPGARVSLPVAELLAGMQALVARLLGLSFVRTPPAKGETWHWSVLRFELHEDPAARAARIFSLSSPESSASPGAPATSGRTPAAPSADFARSPASLRGVLYLDLFARPNKTRLLAQFTVRGSKRLSYAHAQGWRLGGPLWTSSVQELPPPPPAEADAHVARWAGPELRQLPCTALVCSFAPPAGLDMSQREGPDVDRLLQDTHLTASLSRSLLHEFGHVLHSLLSETELQHLSGTRGVVDFAEFPSNLFEHFVAPLVLDKLRAPDACRPREAVCNFAHLSALQLVMHALMDQAFYSYHPEASAPPANASRSPPAHHASAGDAQLAALHAWVDQSYGRHAWLAGAPLEGVTARPIADILGKPHVARFEHIIHYGGSYFCYLLCRVMSSFAWQQALAKDPFNREAGKRLHEVLSRGSVDCSLQPILDLAGPGALSAAQRQHLLQNPHLLPVEPFLQELQAEEALASGLPFP
ncbi:peptidase family M3 protein [Besnoitia besnoiti]|uniref:Peptidase family M3 protein n=1 Tax=Besnoitia besnoiti TaxID=94643 RepID=A0A2A9M6M0_BESBE|nr:peptidase family M3 protein [Besnoitia besnoiti]PFH31060.1 peptidase family M3 protein [Besnoitia besnoiti]